METARPRAAGRGRPGSNSQIPHATRVPLQQDAQAVRLPLQHSLRSRRGCVATTRLTSQARSVLTKTESSASLDRLAKSLAASRRKVVSRSLPATLDRYLTA